MNIDGRKIIIYGTGKRQKDFEYIFEQYKISYYVDDSDEEYTKNWIKLKQEKKEKIFVIICVVNAESANDRLEKIGLVYRENFCFAEDLFYQLNYVNRKIGKRKLAIWGTGAVAERIRGDFALLYPDLSEFIYIDNNENKNEFNGHFVVNPKKIKQWKDYYIVIATDYYREIKKQLEEYGLKEEQDFIFYEVALFDTRKMMKKTFCAEQKTKYVCSKPFGFGDIAIDKFYICCPGFQKQSVGDFQYRSFDDLWNSVEAQILRLSVLNGTYSFCWLDRCNKLLENDLEVEEPVKYRKRAGKYPNVFINSVDSSCNLKCESCRSEIWVCRGTEFQRRKEIAEKVMKEIIPYTNELWMCGDGEIFYSPVYKYMLEKENSGRESIAILTNGTAFTVEKWEKIKAKYKNIKISVSVDGISKNVYEGLRRGAKYEKLVENLEYMGELREKEELSLFTINILLSQKNFAELELLPDFAKRFHIDTVKLQKYVNYHYSSEEFYNCISLHEENGNMKTEYRNKLIKVINEYPGLFGFSGFEVDIGKSYQKKNEQNEYVVGIL